MIRLTFMTDARRVIGASTPEGNAGRFALLPPTLPQVMSGLYAAAAVAVGGRSLAGAAQPVQQIQAGESGADPIYSMCVTLGQSGTFCMCDSRMAEGGLCQGCHSTPTCIFPRGRGKRD